MIRLSRGAQRFCFLALICCWPLFASATLKPWFDPSEYIEVLQRCAGQANHIIFPKTAPKLTYKKVYSSPEIGLHNRWELWLSPDGATMVVNLRGTVSSMDNGLENIFAAMIPATGALKLSDTGLFHYRFAADAHAYIHAGWTIGICSMIPDIISRAQEQYNKGVKNMIIEGHSQGGALAFLLRSYLHYQTLANNFPADMIIKTYCSAAPKPGNLNYAYDYNFITRDGWGLTVVNSLDWVPEMPFTIQRYSDINEVNPFTGNKTTLKKQNFFVRLYLRHVYNRTNRATRKAQHRYERYLGRTVYRFLRRYLPDSERPQFVHSASYMPAGIPVVLIPDEAYHKQFSGIKNHMFRHHFYEQYYFLVRHIYMKEGV
jgi:hypothetical protein